jgi:hypothetical protein
MKELNSYLISAETYDLLGNKQDIDGATTKEKCQIVLQRHMKSKGRRYPHKHNMCGNRGYLEFDDGKVFLDKENKRTVYTKWIKTCDCVNRIVDKNEKLKNILLRNS